MQNKKSLKFIAALFRKDKNGHNPGVHRHENKKLWYSQAVGYNSAKKGRRQPIGTWNNMDESQKRAE